MTKIIDPHRQDDGSEETVLDETRRAPATPTPTPTPTSGWLTTSGAITHGRFAPGTILGGRYLLT